MKTILQTSLLLAGIALAGCASNRTAASTAARPDYFQNRVTYTGSNIPRPRNQVTDTPLFSTAPSQSVARNTPSLYPTDPVVGANAGPTNAGDIGPNPNVGAGPAGSSPLPSAN